MSRSLRSVLLASAICGIATAASAADLSYSFAESPQENVYLSEHYDWLLETNWGFRHYRMAKECGPIDDESLHGQCLASFAQYEPWRGGYR